jgi:SAM-dependent methyltransferase
MIKKAIVIFRARGLSGLLRAAISRVRGLLAGRATSFSTYKTQLVGKSGIEIGGPSQVFSKRGIFPAYPIVGNLDNCNYCNSTVWSGVAEHRATYHFDPNKPDGQQHIAEATAMEKLPSGAYDFVLSSHMLEHSANPILALSEWKRLLKCDGILVLLLPDKKHTFDHRRPTTTMTHLIADFNAGTKEDDLTHLPEILALHDLEHDPEAGDMATFKARSMRNFENRCLHQHVFDAQLAVDLVEYAGLQVKAVEEIRPHHILLVVQNSSADLPPHT